MLMYKAVLCFVLVSSYPIHLALTDYIATVKEYQEKGRISPTPVRALRVCLWLFVLWYLYLYLKYCYGYYVQCRILYSPSWSAKVEKMGRCVCFDSEFTDSSRRRWPVVDNHVTSESANQVPETKPTTKSLPQTPNHELVLYIPFNVPNVSFKGVVQLHGVMNLALAQRQRCDFIGPRSPIVPLKGLVQLHGVMNLALAQRQRRDFIGPRSLIVPLKGVVQQHGVMNLSLAQRQRRDFIGPRSPIVPLLLTDLYLAP